MTDDIFGRPIRVIQHGDEYGQYAVTKLTAEQVTALAADGDALNLNKQHEVSAVTRFVLLQICDAVGTEQFRKQLGFSHDKALVASDR